MARRYGVFPPSIDLGDPEQLLWVRRAWIFERLEADRDKARADRESHRREPLQLRNAPIPMKDPGDA